MRRSPFAEIAVPLGIHGTFSYSIPPNLAEVVVPGARVEIPWGKKIITGYVVSLSDEVEIAQSKVRQISAVLDDEPAIIPEILELCRWASYYYLAPIGEMLRAALPSNMSSRGKRVIEIIATDEEIELAVSAETISIEDKALLSVIARERGDFNKVERFARGTRSALERLEEASIIEVNEVLKDSAGIRFDRWVVLADRDGLEDLVSNTQQATVIDLLRAAGGELMHAEIVDRGGSRSALSTLARHGGLRIEKRRRRHELDPFFGTMVESEIGDLEHSESQRNAIDEVLRSVDEFQPFLLQGVTGSGKTEIYIEIARQVVKRGGQVIMLVPEIALTPMLAARLKERFDDRVAILHSNLSVSERHDQWWRARRDEVQVAVGPRSALFTPFRNLGLIVVDEEGDGAYKQDESPRYHARDLAVVRARLHSIPVVLGSATPSLESRWNVDRGRYRLLTLGERVMDRSLPLVETVDIRKEKAEKEDRGLVMYSARLREELRRVFEAGEQAIILINRRGYAPFLLCRECDNDFRCRDCSVTMTVHLRDRSLICHYCGYRIAIPRECLLCGGEILQPIGYGTEKVTERFKEYFPGIGVEVLDRDSVRRRGELIRVLDRFRDGRAQALIGTQIISKGHDFPNVTLTAVLNADSVLGYPDFRSAEKTYYLLTQVAGRAGRGDRPGRVLIQTGLPEHYAIRHSIAQDYETFYEAEIEFRRRFHYPPTTTMIAVLFRGEDLAAVERAALGAGERLHRELKSSQNVRVQGPSPAPLARIKGNYRFQILIRSSDRKSVRAAVEKAIVDRDYSGVEVVVDVDPLNIL